MGRKRVRGAPTVPGHRGIPPGRQPGHDGLSQPALGPAKHLGGLQGAVTGLGVAIGTSLLSRSWWQQPGQGLPFVAPATQSCVSAPRVAYGAARSARGLASPRTGGLRAEM